MHGINLKPRFASKRAALAGAATLVGLGLIAGGGYSAWDATTDGPDSGTVTAAAVSLSAEENATQTAKWSADLKDAMPGAKKDGYIDVKNTGSVPLNVIGHLKADDTSTGLEAALTLKVIESAVPFDDASYDPANDKVILDEQAVAKTGVDTKDPVTVAPGQAAYLKIVTTLPDTAAVDVQSLTAKYNLGFTGTTS